MGKKKLILISALRVIYSCLSSRGFKKAAMIVEVFITIITWSPLP